MPSECEMAVDRFGLRMSTPHGGADGVRVGVAPRVWKSAALSRLCLVDYASIRRIEHDARIIVVAPENEYAAIRRDVAELLSEFID